MDCLYFFNRPTLAQSTTYAIFVKAIHDGDPANTAGEFDGTNYVNLGFDNESNDTVRFGGVWSWNSDTLLNINKDVEDDAHIKVYTMQ